MGHRSGGLCGPFWPRSWSESCEKKRAAEDGGVRVDASSCLLALEYARTGLECAVPISGVVASG